MATDCDSSRCRVRVRDYRAEDETFRDFIRRGEALRADLEARAAAALADSADRLFSAPGIVREDSAPPTFADWEPILEALRN